MPISSRWPVTEIGSASYDEGPGREFTTSCPEPAGGWETPGTGLVSDDDFSAGAAVAQSRPGFVALWVDYVGDYTPEEMDQLMQEGKPVLQIMNVVVTDDVDGTLDAMKPMLAFYVGGMGAKDMNFHKQVFARMGYEKEADEIQDLFFAGKRDEAVAAVPAQAVADISLVGSVAQIRDRIGEWEDAGVTHLVIGAQDLDHLRRVAEVVLG